MPGMTTAPRTDRRDLELANCLHKTGADCRAIKTQCELGVYQPGASDRRGLQAYTQLRRDAAAGIDKVTAAEYEAGIWARIADLHRRLVAKEYRAQPARRVWIPKSDGGQ